jgi:hypothetical protein
MGSDETLLTTILHTANEILTSAIVIIAFSMLLYNLTRNRRNRIARSSAIVLACVTLSYVSDAFLSLNPSPTVYEAVLRLQWIGIAFIPAALFHLSDALLATTGLPSRGRRRRVVRILYLIGTVFLATAAFTDLMIVPERQGQRFTITGGDLFWLYLIYFVCANAVAFINLQRARRRSLTRNTARRMSYLQLAILTPAIGVFPFSAVMSPGEEFSLSILLVVNLANIIVIIMLIFLSYPLSFFGSDLPDKAVKIDLLRFLLRGPGTGLLALVTMILTADAIRILGLSGEDFMPFAVVAVVLLWQWTIALALPWLERLLVYNRADDEDIIRLQRLSERLLTRDDLLQQLEANLGAICDLLRARVAMVLSVKEDAVEIVQSIGQTPAAADIQAKQAELQAMVADNQPDHSVPSFQTWQTYQVTPLYSHRTTNGATPIGMLIIETTPNHFQGDDEETHSLQQLINRTGQMLDDMTLQQEILAALEGLLPQISVTRRDDDLEYRHDSPVRAASHLPDREEIKEQVHAALRDYWGGPGVTRSRLLDLKIVQNALLETGNPARALRQVMQQAIEMLRPDGERNLTSLEWTMYNIIDLRFIEGKKVNDVARRMSLSQADLYRKQRLAIEAVTDALLEMERQAPPA